MAKTRRFGDDAKVDKMMERRKARKGKAAIQEEAFAPVVEKYAEGGKVRGMGSAIKGGRFHLS